MIEREINIPYDRLNLGQSAMMAVIKLGSGNSPGVQWLELCASTAGGPGLSHGWGTKIPHNHVAQPKNNNNNFKNKKKNKQLVHHTLAPPDSHLCHAVAANRAEARACGDVSCQIVLRVWLIKSQEAALKKKKS